MGKSASIHSFDKEPDAGPGQLPVATRSISCLSEDVNQETLCAEHFDCGPETPSPQDSDGGLVGMASVFNPILWLSEIEAIVFAAGKKGASFEQVSGAFSSAGYLITPDQIETAVQALHAHWRKKNPLVRLVWSRTDPCCFKIEPEFDPYWARIDSEFEPLLGEGTLETLAIILAKQPISRSQIEEFRGIQVSSRILRKLIELRWIERVGYMTTQGRSSIYMTTPVLLEALGVTTIEEALEGFDLLDCSEMELSGASTLQK